MTKVFVVSATSFEYNDEVHSITEDGGGTPVAAFATKEDAEANARQRTIDDFLKGYYGSQLHCFGYGLDNVFQRMPKFLDMDEEIFFDESKYHDLQDIIRPNELSDDDLIELADSLDFKPHFVTEITVG